MRITPIAVGLTLAASLTACSHPVTLAQAPAKEEASETAQLTSDEPTRTDEAGESAAAGTATAAEGTDAGAEADAATADAKREFTMDTPQESMSVSDAVADIVTSGSLLFADIAWPQCEATEGIPVPAFSVPVESASMNEDSYSSGANATWHDVPEEEVVAYLKSLRDAGFVYGTSVSRATDSFSYSASDTDDDTYATTRRSVSLSYYRPYGEDEHDYDYALDVSVWLSRGDSGPIAYDVPENARSEEATVDER